MPHLSYMGDAEIGAGTNVGAGSITANLSHQPGKAKSRTRIGRDVKVAVDTMFVAPVTVDDDAWTAPGTVVTEDVPANALVGFAAPPGRSRRDAVESGTIEQTLPGLEAAPEKPAPKAGHAIPLTPQKRLMVVCRSARTRISRSGSPSAWASSSARSS